MTQVCRGVLPNISSLSCHFISTPWLHRTPNQRNEIYCQLITQAYQLKLYHLYGTRDDFPFRKLLIRFLSNRITYTN